MKKILVTTAICLVGAATMMAQGRINFNNAGGPAGTPIRITDGVVAPVILGTASTAQFGIGPASVQVRLFAGLTSSSLSPVLIGTAADQAFVLNTVSLLASFQGSFAGGSSLPLAGFDGSNPVFLQMTLTSANGLYSGISPIIQVALATGAAPSTALFSTVLTPSTSQWNAASQWSGNLGAGSVNITPVPEPTSMVLAGLGAASLLIFRRRK